MGERGRVRNALPCLFASRYFVFYQNMLFQFESEKLEREPCGMALLEGSYCEKTLVLRTSRDTRTAPQHDVSWCFSVSPGRQAGRQAGRQTGKWASKPLLPLQAV